MTTNPASLIIPSRDRPEMLAAAVESVLQGTLLPDEIVIVDQSDAPHPTLARRTGPRSAPVRYFRMRAVGLSRANNEGMRAARNDQLVFLHDDMLVAPTWWAVLTGSATDAGCRTVITGRILPGPAESPAAFAPSTKADPLAAFYVGRVGTDVLFPGNMTLHRSIVHDIGGFDERLGPGTRFPAAEDNDFCLRLLEAGYRIQYVPDAIVYHRAWRSSTAYLPLRWAYGLGQGAYYAKHLSLRDRYMLKRLGGDLAKRMLRAASKLGLRPRDAAGDAIFVAGVLCGMTRWLLTQPQTR